MLICPESQMKLCHDLQVKELQKALSLSKMNFSLAVCRQIIR